MDRHLAKYTFHATVIFIAGMLVLIGVLLSNYDTNATREKFRQELAARGHALSIVISTEIAHRAIVGNALAASLSQFPDMSADDYDALAEKLRGEKSDIINIAAAPDLVVSHVFPKAQNSSVIGLDYNQPSPFGSGVKEAIAQRDLVLVGPIDLIQGVKGFILRVPVFNLSSGTQGAEPWGMVSVVLDANVFFDHTGITNPIEGAKIGLRRTAVSKGAEGIILGSQENFGDDAILVPFKVGRETWELGLIEDLGALSVGVGANAILISTGLIVAAFLLLMNLFNKSRQQRQRAQLHLGEAIEALDDGFTLYDSQDRLIMCNSKMYEQYGFSLNERLEGKTFREIIQAGLSRGKYPQAEGQERQWLEERVRLHNEKTQAVEVKLSDGTWLKVVSKTLPDGSRVGIRMNITDLKNAREAAEASTVAMTEFVNNINHELRTPLTVIGGFVGFLRNPELMSKYKALSTLIDTIKVDKVKVMSALDSFVEESKTYADRAHVSLNHLQNLVRDTLDLSKIQNGSLAIDIEEVELAPILQECTAQFSQLASKKGLRLDCNNPEILARTDANRLRQILINVLGNAIKFTDSGEINVTAVERNGSACISIKDTGIGISQENLMDVYNKFWQADGSGKRRYGGTGLGLAITRNLVDLLGGEIRIQSELGQGSEFTICLPLAK